MILFDRLIKVVNTYVRHPREGRDPDHLSPYVRHPRECGDPSLLIKIIQKKKKNRSKAWIPAFARMTFGCFLLILLMSAVRGEERNEVQRLEPFERLSYHSFFNNRPLNILVFSPHPDDDIIGCGGSIINHLQAGNYVAIVYMTSGEVGNPSKKHPKNLGTIREHEARVATTFLGVTDITFLHIPDGNVTCNQSSIDICAQLIKDKHPDIIYAPHSEDNHQDHVVTFQIVREAVTQSAKDIKKILCYEVWTPIQQPSYVENITNVIDKKIEALRFHKSQIKDIQYDEGVRALNRYRGVMTEKGDYVECFKIVDAYAPDSEKILPKDKGRHNKRPNQNKYSL